MMSDPQGNVVSALAAVMADLPAIGKDSRGPRDQGGYAYRGIEAITKEAAPLLAKHGVVFVPQVVSMEIRDLVVNSKPWTDTILTVRYRICGPGGPEDYVEACVVGIGRDNSDKGANKAMTQAFKYALTQSLCISDAASDTDGQTHEADANGSAGPISLDNIDGLGPRDLNTALQAHGLPLGGTLDEMRERLRVAAGEITGEPGAGGTILTGYSGDDDAGDGTPVAASPVLPGSGAAVADSAAPLPLIPDEGRDVNATTGDGPHSADQRPDPHGYTGWPKADLLLECAALELDVPKSYTKDQLVAALRAWNATYRPDYVEDAERPF